MCITMISCYLILCLTLCTLTSCKFHLVKLKNLSKRKTNQEGYKPKETSGRLYNCQDLVDILLRESVKVVQSWTRRQANDIHFCYCFNCAWKVLVVWQDLICKMFHKSITPMTNFLLFCGNDIRDQIDLSNCSDTNWQMWWRPHRTLS